MFLPSYNIALGLSVFKCIDPLSFHIYDDDDDVL